MVRWRPHLRPVVDFHWLPGLARKTVSEADPDDPRYHNDSYGDAGLPADVPVDVVDYLDNIFAQKALSDDDGEFSSTTRDRFVIARAPARLSRTVTTSSTEFANLVWVSVGKVDGSRSAAAKAEKKVERLKELVSIAEKTSNNSLNEVASFRGWVAVASLREAELLCSAPVSSSQTASTTAELRQASDKIS